VAKDQKFAEQVRDDFTKADLSPRERTIAAFAVKVSKSAGTCNPEDLNGLRDVGLRDKDILSLVQIISYYNMSNRFFEALSTVEP
jgi:uncharacterized peroxidase-related enzyme